MANSMMANALAAPASDDLVELYHKDDGAGGSIVYYGEDNTKVTRGEMSDRPELYREDTKSGGSLIFYGAPTGPSQRRDTDESTKMSKRCLFWGCNEKCPDSATPSCDAKNNGAQNELCDKLLAELGDHSEVKIGQSPRQICYKNGKACCLSWGTKLPDTLTKGDLYKHANTIIKQCTANGISGKIGNVNVLGTCTEVCVSSRGTHC
ncbi:hypothetical protein CC86DRAFT_468808 [Ophiobolus disseminans]|uniref:WD-like domain-containing protein n=1 Tax=Ophiobolus disseminans TaxID=1469910 RepID=A0A6A6ZTM7_9PLEO|nr:hypothetical protein CC86DRAFT_468808 [Ophiobolus disseminans]